MNCDKSIQDLAKEHFPETTTSERKKKTKKVYDTIPDPRQTHSIKGSDVSRECLTFLDFKKNKVVLWPNMVDSADGTSICSVTHKPCRNCHHQYVTRPIGCPLRITCKEYENKKITNKQNSEVVVPVLISAVFETENLFCTLPCVKSYIISKLSDRNFSSKYMDSLGLLTIMMKLMTDNITSPNSEDEFFIPCAPPIDVLENYGGHLSIDEYRENNGVKYSKVIYYEKVATVPSVSYTEETTNNLL